MARSLKKGPFVHHSLEKKVIKNVEENKKSVIKTWSRAFVNYSRFCWSDDRCS
jgi:small subunit ribosomal protein S19